VVGTEAAVRHAAAGGGADVLAALGIDEVVVVEAGRPVVHGLGVRDFLLDVRVRQMGLRERLGVDPGAAERGAVGANRLLSGYCWEIPNSGLLFMSPRNCVMRLL